MLCCRLWLLVICLGVVGCDAFVVLLCCLFGFLGVLFGFGLICGVTDLDCFVWVSVLDVLVLVLSLTFDICILGCFWFCWIYFDF